MKVYFEIIGFGRCPYLGRHYIISVYTKPAYGSGTAFDYNGKPYEFSWTYPETAYSIDSSKLPKELYKVFKHGNHIMNIRASKIEHILQGSWNLKDKALNLEDLEY